MKDAEIQLRPVNSLLVNDAGEPAEYWIPNYQRGYRWTPLQVTQLLDDIWEFIQTSEGKRESFYCLQPLVIKPRESGDFEVVDGQQRLTTIYILLTHVEEILNFLGKERFKIRFETRGEANEPFLENIDMERAEENVDFFHICAAKKAIENWFSERDSSHMLLLIQHLLNDDEAGRNVKVIWYELPENEKPVAAFTRLNVGKIPLTNDELIRALFLRRAAAENTEDGLALRIAHEWDQLEKALERDAFWYFLSNETASNHNRIGLIFELVVADELTELLSQDTYGVFHAFNERLAESSAEKEWLAVKQAFMSLEEWYEDRELFHITGFLIQQGEDIGDLLKKASQLNKSEFSTELRSRVFAKAIGGELQDLDEQEIQSRIANTCENLNYETNKQLIHRILLLFNLTTLLSNSKSNLRFQFDSFKNEQWDIEHVRSVAAIPLDRHNDRREWLNQCRGYLFTQEGTEALVSSIDGFLDLPQRDADDSSFEEVKEAVLDYFHESDEGEEHDIGNLTLLDSRTNRSYKNAVFAVKRKRLLELDQSGIFVPLCTRNVFLKCYNPQVDNLMFWSGEDADAYREVIIDMLTGFFVDDSGAQS